MINKKVNPCITHGKNDFAEESKILLEILKIISNATKNFDFLAILSVLHNYFDKSIKLFF